MTAKTHAAAIRSAIKAAGFKAGVSMLPGYSNAVRVYPAEYGLEFTADQIALFCNKAVELGMTAVRGTAIDPAHESLLTGKGQWEFWA
jgi:hypothetical protein